jgi:hypothetical protein
MSNIQIVNFVEVCSNALLAIVDNEESFEKIDNVYNININKRFKDYISFYINSNLKNCRMFGYKTIIVNTCKPFDNWRKDERGCPIRGQKYALTDTDSFSIDKIKLENILENEWKKVKKKEKDFIFLNFNTVDYIDAVSIIKKELLTNVCIKPTHFFMIRDINIEYMHLGNISKSIYSEVEIKLRTNNLII